MPRKQVKGRAPGNNISKAKFYEQIDIKRKQLNHGCNNAIINIH